MRHYRNEKVSMYHDKRHERNVKDILEEKEDSKTELTIKQIEEANQEYIRQLRLQKGIRE